MKSRPEWSKLSSAQLSTATPCAGSPYQLLRSNGNSAVTRRAGVVAEVVPADLAAVVGEPVGERLRLRQQQHAHVLVGVAGEQHHVGGLEVFLAALEIDDAAHAAAPSSTATLVTIACVTTPSRPVPTAFGMVLTAVEFLALTWQPPRLQKP